MLKLILITFMLFLFAGVCLADTQDYTIGEVADAIFMAEGGYKATYLYGIRSIPYKDEIEARRICVNSIRNNIKRWKKQGKKGDFLEFMSRRFCPIACENDTGTNKFWVRNVKAWLVKNRKVSINWKF